MGSGPHQDDLAQLGPGREAAVSGLGLGEGVGRLDQGPHLACREQRHHVVAHTLDDQGLFLQGAATQGGPPQDRPASQELGEVHLRLAASPEADDYDPAPGRQAPQVAAEARPSHQVHHDVEGAVVGDLFRSHARRPEAGHLRPQRLVPDAGHHLRSSRGCELDGGRPHSPRRPGHQHPVPDTEAGLGEQGIVGSAVGLREAARLAEGPLGRHGQGQAFVDHSPLGLAGARDQAHHPVTGAERGGPVPHRLDRPGALQAGLVGRDARWRRVAPGPLEQVRPVEPGRLHPDQQFVGLGDRSRALAPGEPALGDDDRSHMGHPARTAPSRAEVTRARGCLGRLVSVRFPSEGLATPARGSRSGTAPGNRPRWSGWSGWSRWRGLVALCVGLNLAEASLVVGLDHGALPTLAPQASAIAPLGVFGDLRWVSVYHDSWPVFAAELLAMLLVRGGLTAASVALAWPEGRPRPTASALVARSVLATAFSALLLVPSVVVLFGLAAVPVSWLFLAGVPAAVFVAFVAHPIVVSGDWWRRPMALRAIGWVALAFVTLSLATSALAATPSALWPVICALSGLFNAWSWSGLVGAVVGGTVAGFTRGTGATAGASPAPARVAGHGQPVLLVSGYGSSWDGQPLAYDGQDTVKPLAQLDRLLLAQVWSLYAKTGQLVDVVAESEGALVAKTALLAEPESPVSTLVLASPLVGLGRVSYPVEGDRGWGVATNAAMRILGDALQGVAPIDLSPDSSFFASLNAEAPALQ